MTDQDTKPVPCDPLCPIDYNSDILNPTCKKCYFGHNRGELYDAIEIALNSANSYMGTTRNNFIRSDIGIILSACEKKHYRCDTVDSLLEFPDCHLCSIRKMNDWKHMPLSVFKQLIPKYFISSDSARITNLKLIKHTSDPVSIIHKNCGHIYKKYLVDMLNPSTTCTCSKCMCPRCFANKNWKNEFNKCTMCNGTECMASKNLCRKCDTRQTVSYVCEILKKLSILAPRAKEDSIDGKNRMFHGYDKENKIAFHYYCNNFIYPRHKYYAGENEMCQRYEYCAANKIEFIPLYSDQYNPKHSRSREESIKSYIHYHVMRIYAKKRIPITIENIKLTYGKKTNVSDKTKKTKTIVDVECMLCKEGTSYSSADFKNMVVSELPLCDCLI